MKQGKKLVVTIEVAQNGFVVEANRNYGEKAKRVYLDTDKFLEELKKEIKDLTTPRPDNLNIPVSAL